MNCAEGGEGGRRDLVLVADVDGKGKENVVVHVDPGRLVLNGVERGDGALDNEPERRSGERRRHEHESEGDEEADQPKDGNV